MEEAFEEGQGPHRAVEPVMIIVNSGYLDLIDRTVKRLELSSE
jgi:hypothetical protein